MTVTWDELPQPVRAVVEQHTGPVAATVDVTPGANSDIVTVLRDKRGRSVFLKGVNGVSRRMRFLRNEITAGQRAIGVAPAVLFYADVDGWLVVGFEHVPGRPARLAPGSPDLPLVAAVVEKISTMSGIGVRSLRDRWGVTDWWCTLAAEAPSVVDGWDVPEMTRWCALVPDLVDGDRLLHTDLHGDQFLVGSSGVRVVDWGFPGAGAGWVDTAFLTLRLVEAGHHPADADAWARSLTSWATVDRDVLTAFSVYLAGMWSCWAVGGTGSERRARLARDYAAWRLTSTR